MRLVNDPWSLGLGVNWAHNTKWRPPEPLAPNRLYFRGVSKCKHIDSITTLTLWKMCQGSGGRGAIWRGQFTYLFCYLLFTHIHSWFVVVEAIHPRCRFLQCKCTAHRRRTCCANLGVVPSSSSISLKFKKAVLGKWRRKVIITTVHSLTRIELRLSFHRFYETYTCNCLTNGEFYCAASIPFRIFWCRSCPSDDFRI